MITPKDKIGYIRRATVDGKDQFKFIEAKIKSVRVGKKQTSVYTDKFYALDNEPFITNDEYSEHCRKQLIIGTYTGQEAFLMTADQPRKRLRIGERKMRGNEN